MHTQANGQTRIVAYGKDSSSGLLVPFSISSGTLNVNIFPQNNWFTKTSITNSAVAVQLRAAGGNIVQLVGLQISSGALGAATTIQITDGTNTIWEISIPITGFPTPMIVPFAAPPNTTQNVGGNLYVKTAAAVTGTIYINAQGLTFTP